MGIDAGTELRSMSMLKTGPSGINNVVRLEANGATILKSLRLRHWK